MTDYMKEAKRLLEEHDCATMALAVGSEYAEVPMATRSALLAHIQRGAVPDVDWLSNVIRAADGSHSLGAGALAEKIVEAMLAAAAPAPDQFRDAAKMMAVQPSCMTCGDHGMIGGLLPNGGGYEADPCPDCTAPAPAEVPMPEPDASLHDDGHYLSRAALRTSDFYHQAGWRLEVVSMAKASTYGAACRAAGEAAGYARGLRNEDVFHDVTVALRALLDMPDNENTKRHARVALQRAGAALRGEVK